MPEVRAHFSNFVNIINQNTQKISLSSAYKFNNIISKYHCFEARANDRQSPVVFTMLSMICEET